MNQTARQCPDQVVPPSDILPGLGRHHWTRKLFYIGLTAVVLFFLGRVLIKALHETSWSEVHLKPLFLVLGILCLALNRFLAGAILHFVLRAFGHRNKPANSVAANWVAALGRYIPGKMASVGGLVVLLTRLRVQLSVAMGATFLFMGLTIFIGILFSAPLLLLESVRTTVPAAWLWCGLVALGGIVCLHPRVFIGLCNFGLRRLRREPLRTRLQERHLLAATGLGAALYLSQGMAAWFIARALTNVGLGHYWLFVATVAFASVAGILAFFAPAGIGVREWVYLLLLGPVLGDGPAALVAVLVRLILVLSDIGTGTVGMLILRSHFASSPEAPKTR